MRGIGIAILLGLLVACGSAGSVEEAGQGGAGLDPLLDAALTDVRSGESFRIRERTAAGEYVLVEFMAVWCPLCLTQQNEVAKLEAEPPEGVVSLSLDIDPNEEAELLRAHAEFHDFPWPFAIAPLDASRAVAEGLGRDYLNPTSTPMILVRPDDSVVPLRFGIKSGSELRLAIEQNRLP